MTSSLEPMEKQMVTIDKALAQLDTRCGEIADQRAATEDSPLGLAQVGLFGCLYSYTRLQKR